MGREAEGPLSDEQPRSAGGATMTSGAVKANVCFQEIANPVSTAEMAA